MEPNTKACVAFIAGCVVSGKKCSSVYDYTQGKHISISGNVSATNANIFDYDRGCYIQGSLGNMYDHGNGAYVQLKMNGNQFSGYDYHSGIHFSGTVNGNSISLVANGHSNYSI